MIRGTNSKVQKSSSHFKIRRRRGSYLGITGKYPSPQNRHCLFYESFRERDLIVWLAFDPTVEAVEDHPFTIKYKEAGRNRSYTPDLLVRFKPSVRRRPLLIEVKTEAELERSGKELEPAFRAARAYCKDHQMKFELVTEKVLVRPRVRNLRFLFPYRLGKPDSILDGQVKKLVAGGPTTLRNVTDSLGDRNYRVDDVVSAVWRLAALQVVEVDLDTPLSMNSRMEAKSWSTKI